VTVRTDRPRIWLTPALLATVKGRAARGTQRWRDLQALCDRPGATWDVGLINYALCYQVTGDLAYAQKALTLMQESMQSGLGQITRDSYYDCRTFFPTSAVCLDWCHDAMTAAERAALIKDIETCAAAVWPETNPSRTGQWAVDDPANNYYHGFMTSWMAGLALSGESSQAASILALSQTKWDTKVLPCLAGQAAGGYFVEGTSYGVDSTRLMAFYLLANSTATDTDLYGQTPWVKDAVTALIHLTVPAMDALVPLGDQTKSASGALRDPARTPMLIAASRGDVLAKAWLDNAVPNRMTERPNAWEEALFYPE
jgi:hypothetical protein